MHHLDFERRYLIKLAVQNHRTKGTIMDHLNIHVMLKTETIKPYFSNLKQRKKERENPNIFIYR
jgi:hypothetical protein